MNNSNNDQTTSHLREVVTSPSSSLSLQPQYILSQFRRIIAASSTNLSFLFPASLRECVQDLRLSFFEVLQDRRYIYRDFLAFARSTMKDTKIDAQAFYQNYIKEEIWRQSLKPFLLQNLAGIPLAGTPLIILFVVKRQVRHLRSVHMNRLTPIVAPQRFNYFTLLPTCYVMLIFALCTVAAKK